MPNKRPISSKGSEVSPLNDFSTSDVHLTSDPPRRQSSVFIEKIKIAPSGQERMLLGTYPEDKPPRGFAIVLTPDPSPADSAVTEVANMGEAGQHKLVLHIANYGDKAIEAEVWQL